MDGFLVVSFRENTQGLGGRRLDQILNTPINQDFFAPPRHAPCCKYTVYMWFVNVASESCPDENPRCFFGSRTWQKMEEKVGEKGSRSSKFNSEIVRLEFV